MSAALDFDTGSYRAQLNPDFVRRVREQRKAAAVKQANAERRAAFERACEEAAKAAEAARAARRAEVEAAEQQLVQMAEIERLRIAALPIPRTKFQIIEYRACRVFGVHREQLNSLRRDNTIVAARHFVMYWTLRLTAMSMPQVGRLMGGKDHTTVHHGRRSYVERRAKMGRTLRPVR